MNKMSKENFIIKCQFQFLNTFFKFEDSDNIGQLYNHLYRYNNRSSIIDYDFLLFQDFISYHISCNTNFKWMSAIGLIDAMDAVISASDLTKY